MLKLRKLPNQTNKKLQFTWFEMVNMPCPVCDKRGWCLINGSYDEVVCMRHIDNSRPRKINGTPYRLEGEKPAINQDEIDYNEGEKRQADNVQHMVHSLLIRVFGLTQEDKEHMMKERGLTEEQLELRGYFSTSIANLKKQIVNGKSIWEDEFAKMGLPTDAWKGIAGFYFDEKGQCPVFMTKPGIAIPCRNAFGQIVGLQVRISESEIKYFAKGIARYQGRVTFSMTEEGLVYVIRNQENYSVIATGIVEDNHVSLPELEIEFDVTKSPKYLFVSSTNMKNGTSAVSVPHYAFADSILAKAEFDYAGNAKYNLLDFMNKKSVILTEGLLKGDIVASYIDDTKFSKLAQVVVSIAGVNVWKKAVKDLETHGLTQVFSAFDQDFEDNEAVYAQMESMIDYLLENGFGTYALSWEVGKGLDDCILADVPESDKGLSIVSY
uniref:hypothetical protein n=1 Tax=Streptococcus pluranimalium TaxID=82348 RepID=UPI003F690349